MYKNYKCICGDFNIEFIVGIFKDMIHYEFDNGDGCQSYRPKKQCFDDFEIQDKFDDFYSTFVELFNEDWIDEQVRNDKKGSFVINRNGLWLNFVEIGLPVNIVYAYGSRYMVDVYSLSDDVIDVGDYVKITTVKNSKFDNMGGQFVNDDYVKFMNYLGCYVIEISSRDISSYDPVYFDKVGFGAVGCGFVVDVLD